jgi:hypothetical protein
MTVQIEPAALQVKIGDAARCPIANSFPSVTD